MRTGNQVEKKDSEELSEMELPKGLLRTKPGNIKF